MNDITPGARIREVRKRRGMTQRDLAERSGVSLAWVKKLEQDHGDTPRLETLRKLAIALRVDTSTLITRHDPDRPDESTTIAWQAASDALYAPPPQPEDEPTAAGVLSVIRAARVPLAAARYSQVRDVLPALIRDAEALNGAGSQARSRALNLTGWLLVMNRQWDAAETAVRLALDAAGDRLDAAAVVNTRCWLLLRQGRLAEARDLAVRWADDIEPRFSRATVRELALWGRLLLNVTNAAIRDGRPGEAQDAMRLARAAADRIGTDVLSDTSTARTFGPLTVAMIAGENAAISGDPLTVLAVAERMPRDVISSGIAGRAGSLRHRLDVASALTQLRRYGEAVQVLSGLRDQAPEWLPQQRYARDILSAAVARRRTLTPLMRDLADAVHLPL